MGAHEWVVVAEFDAGYAIGRCQACGQQDLLDVAALVPPPRQAGAPAAELDDAGAASASGAGVTLR